MNRDIKEENVLLTLHAQFANMPLHFRERVCEECNYSTATFYRKMRSAENGIDGKHIHVFSNAEKNKILEIRRVLKDEFAMQMTDLTEKFRD